MSNVASEQATRGDGLRTLAMRTEVAVSKYGCLLERRHAGELPAYWVVRSPDNPHYWFGNCLIFDAPPQAGDLERWMRSFEHEHAGSPSAHRVFRVDRADGDAGESAPFVAAGFELERTHVLSATVVVPPPKLANELDVRPLRTVEEWEAALSLSVEVGVHDDGHADRPSYASFARKRLATYNELQQRGLGHVWGAFLGQQLVGQLGLFHVGELSRFQAVATDSSFRRRGICGTLVYRVCEHALSELPGRRLVMCAAEDYHATRIYQSLGFRITEHVVDFRRPQPGAMR
jgi:ribosomal protein S18 acetylase RimI-like enzyme